MAFIESNTGFRANHISASSMTVNSLSGSLISSASFGSIEIAGFSGKTNLLDFSASINTDSGSVSTRLSSLESGTTTKTLISGSAQIAAEISGAFGAASASFATTTTTNTANVATNTGNISTNTGNITTLQGRNIATGTGLSGGGTLGADRTLAVDFTDSTLKSNISGAFAQASGGLAARIQTIEGSDITNAQALGTTDSPTFAGMTVQGDLTAENLIVSSSIVHFTQSFSSGSTAFGDTLDDNHNFTGSLNISGSGVQLDIANNGSAPFNINGNTTKVANLNADLLDGTSLDAIPAYVATNLAANALSGDKISGGTIDSTTITKLAIGDLSLPSNDNELHVRKLDKVETISGSVGASASFDYMESSAASSIAGNLVHSINVTFSGNAFSFNGDSKPNFQIQPGYRYRFVQDDSSNASHILGFKNAGVDYTTGVRTVGTAGTATAGKTQTTYVELTVTAATPGVLTYYDKTENDDASGAKLVKEGMAGGATLISGSVASTGSFGVIETAQGVTSNHTLRVSGSHVKGGSATTASFGTAIFNGFSSAQRNIVEFSASVASGLGSIGGTSITSMSSDDGTITTTINGAERKLDVNFGDATFSETISGSWKGELSSSNPTVVGGGVSGSAASTFTVGTGGVQIANHLQNNQKTHVGIESGGKYYAISGSAVSTGSFGKLETVAGAVLEDGISGSLTSTGSFGHVRIATTLSASAGTSASFDNIKVKGFAANEKDRGGTSHGAGLLAFSASVAQRLADEMDDVEGQFTVVGSDIQAVKDTRISGSLTVSASHADSASLTVQGQGENVFNVDGTAGRLFTISDTMSGSLFSVADFSGLASLEVFDNDRITLGLNTNPIVVTTNTANDSAQISGSLQSTASFGHVIAADKAVLKNVDLSGNLVPTTDVATDLGSATKRFANLYVGDLLLSNKTRINPDTDEIGNSIDGTWGDYQLQEGKDDLFIENKRTGKTFRFVLQEVKTEEL